MPAEDQIDDDDDPEAAYRALMRKAEELAAERGITPAQAFEKLLVAREPRLRSLVKMKGVRCIRKVRRHFEGFPDGAYAATTEPRDRRRHTTC
jgi:hypothetical protein